jgi:hypothetical protein
LTSNTKDVVVLLVVAGIAACSAGAYAGAGLAGAGLVGGSLMLITAIIVALANGR